MRRLKIPLVFALLLVVCSFHGTPRAGPGPKPKAVDLLVVSDGIFVPGSTAAVRVMTRAVTSMADSRPLAGAKVRVALLDKKKEHQLYTGRTDAHGALEAGFRLPRWRDGSYKMAVRADSTAGSASVERTVQLKRSGRVLLVTDKPIYQPGQGIHLRALVLGSHDLRPLAREALRFEVQDPKGNKVFRKELRTDAFGIGATTFQLADEINLGNYQVEAATVNRDAAQPAAKTVVVKKYVLPKFKVSVETDRPFYLPKQIVKGTVRSDYFFGKPVAGGRVELEGSTFDGVSFKKFSTVRGKTAKDGSWSFEVRLPDYFVGQPLLKGDALVKLAAKITDTANHAEKGTRSVPVSASTIRLAAIPESGRLVPDVPNQVFVVATYPDGSPAQATVTVRAKGKRIARLQTDPAGLAVLTFTPRHKEMRQGNARSKLRFGQHVGYVYTRLLDLAFAARDARGNTAQVSKTFSTDPELDQLLLRADKAIYRSGEVLEATVLGGGGGADTVYVDLVKNRQTLLTRAVPLKRGKGALRLPLGADVFGTVELHAYRLRSDGEIFRDARVLYVQPASELKIEVSPDKSTYRPGQRATIRFRVSDSDGRPRQAALGVIVVDEAVYALQELQPGLEKIYFTLEQELAKPRAQIEFAPADSLPAMIKARQLEQRRQQVAKALLAGAKPAAAPGLWDNPSAKRMQKAANDRWALQSAIQRGLTLPGLVVRTRSGKWAYRADLVDRLVKRGFLTAEQAKDPLGARYTPRSIARLWPELAAQQLVPTMELGRLWQLRWQVQNEINRRTSNFTRLGGRGLGSHLRRAFAAVVRRQPQLAKDPTGKSYSWGRVASLPGFRVEDAVAVVHNQRVNSIFYALRNYAAQRVQRQRPGAYDAKRTAYVLPQHAMRHIVWRKLLARQYMRDVWGHLFQLRKRAKARSWYVVDHRLRFYDLVSAGPDGQLGTADDLTYPHQQQGGDYQQLAQALGIKQQYQMAANRWFARGALGGAEFAGGGGGGRRRPTRAFKALEPMPAATAAPAMDRMERTREDAPVAQKPGDTASAPKKRQVRVREFFPETLAFVPALITDAQGRGKLELAMADSITTWRMTASANSAQGSLGSASQGLKVFQDFFVDLDLPVALTQNDEVSVPVVVYNYLKRPQRVRLKLKAGSWFDLRGSRVQELTLQPSEVAASYYRIRVKGLGNKTLEVRADGSSMSDAIRRQIEILPDGQEQNLVANGRMVGTVSKTLRIPQTAVPGASKILVRLYPGVFSQVIEGMESMLRLPGG